MSESPIELIVSAFQSPDAADQAMKEIVEAKKERLVKIHGAAVVRRDAEGKLHIRERGDVSAGMGAGSGAALGAAIGLFGGPIGALLGSGVGAAIGGVASHLIDTGIPNDRLKQIGEALKPNTSALVAMIEHTWVAELEAELSRAGGDTLAHAVTADIARQLEAGKEVAYSAVAAAGGTITTRTTSDEEGISVQKIVTDGEEMVAGAIEITKDSISGMVTDGKEFVAGVIEKVDETVETATEKVEEIAAEAAEKVEEAKDAVDDATKKD
ncbi:MAG: DUF1269 domain-containing protein [Oscillochloridaceae bacterium umkhey_bin13]